MTISPIAALNAADSTGVVSGATQAAQATQPDGTEMFRDVFQQLVSGVDQTDAAYQADIVRAAAGELQNPHQLLIDGQKANLALQLTISVRNKALEAYNSVVNMQV